MNKELVKFEHVTTDYKEYSNLSDFNLRICNNETTGLVMLDDVGYQVLLRLFQVNMPITAGKICVNESLVNTSGYKSGKNNNISVIDNENRIIRGLSIQDNIFLHGNYNIFRPILKRKRQKRLLQWLCNQYEISLNLNEDCSTLTEKTRCIVELLRAIVNESECIVVSGLSDFLTDREFREVWSMLEKLIHDNYTILFITKDYEEVLQLLDKVEIIRNGTDILTFWKNKEKNRLDITQALVYQIRRSYAGIKLDPVILEKKKEDSITEKEEILTMEHVCTEYIDDLSLNIEKGECLVVKANLRVQNDLINVISKKYQVVSGTIRIREKLLYEYRNSALYPLTIFLIKERALETMPFFTLSYLENLTQGIDIKTNKKLVSGRVNKSLVRELKELVGDKIELNDIYGLSNKELYEMIYSRVLFIKPSLLVIDQPFIDVDFELRNLIIGYIRKFKNMGISIMITTTDYYDYMSIADKIIDIHKGCKIYEFDKSYFGIL